MKFAPSLISIAALGLFSISGALAEDRALMLQLRSGTETVLKVGDKASTTILFPDSVEAIAGFGLVQGDDEIPALSQSSVAIFQYEQSDDLLVLRKLRDGDPCFVTVKMSGRLYLLKLQPDNSPNIAVEFLRDNGGPAAAKEIPQQDVIGQRLDYNPQKLIGILNLARERKVLERSLPAIYTGSKQRNGLNVVTSYDGVNATLHEIQRFPDKDVTIFLGMIDNNLGYDIRFDPQSVTIQCGERVYPAQLVDARGLVPANGKTPIHIVLQGNTSGGQEHLSIENDFRIILPRFMNAKDWYEPTASPEPIGLVDGVLPVLPEEELPAITPEIRPTK